jgi:hypothetical protein
MVGHYILHYSKLTAISAGSNKCYAQMLLPGDTPVIVVEKETLVCA